jgi:hypothetical protein
MTENKYERSKGWIRGRLKSEGFTMPKLLLSMVLSSKIKPLVVFYASTFAMYYKKRTGSPDARGQIIECISIDEEPPLSMTKCA